VKLLNANKLQQDTFATVHQKIAMTTTIAQLILAILPEIVFTPLYTLTRNASNALLTPIVLLMLLLKISTIANKLNATQPLNSAPHKLLLIRPAFLQLSVNNNVLQKINALNLFVIMMQIKKLFVTLKSLLIAMITMFVLWTLANQPRDAYTITKVLQPAKNAQKTLIAPIMFFLAT
jgi:hypothetical protein